jgi:hypothetical protein
MNGCPKLKKLKKGIVSIKFIDSYPHLKNLLYLDNFEIKQDNKQLILLLNNLVNIVNIITHIK